MDQFPQMLYRVGIGERIEGRDFALLIVGDDDDLADALANGWHETTPAAVAADAAAKAKAVEQVNSPADDTPPTRAELEQKATELGLKFDGRTSDKKLAEAIAAKLG